MNLEAQLQQELRQAGYSMTKNRLLVCNTLLRKAPITMSGLISALNEKVDRATVYRIVAVFEEVGIIRRIPIGWKYKLELSDKFTDHHHHAHCSDCNAIIKLPENTEIESAIEKIGADNGFIIQEHALEIHGICKGCQSVKK